MNPIDKISSQLKQSIIHKWSCLEESCSLFYIGESSICLENRIKGHNSQNPSAIYLHSVSNNHHRASICHINIIDQDTRQVPTEATEVIHIRINHPILNHNMGKMYIPEIFNNLLGADGSTKESNQIKDSDPFNLPFQVTGLPEQFAWQIK